jgi:hypothetical protein
MSRRSASPTNFVWAWGILEVVGFELQSAERRQPLAQRVDDSTRPRAELLEWQQEGPVPHVLHHPLVVDRLVRISPHIVVARAARDQKKSHVAPTRKALEQHVGELDLWWRTFEEDRLRFVQRLWYSRSSPSQGIRGPAASRFHRVSESNESLTELPSSSGRGSAHPSLLGATRVGSWRVETAALVAISACIAEVPENGSPSRNRYVRRTGRGWGLRTQSTVDTPTAASGWRRQPSRVAGRSPVVCLSWHRTTMASAGRVAALTR